MNRFFYNINLEGIKDRNKNKFFEEEYEISSSYLPFDERSMAIFSDIHFHPHVDKEIYELLITYTETTKPDFILMPGDQAETNGFIDIKKERAYFEYIIRSLANICPIIMVPGNHEIHNLEIKTYFRKSSKENIKGLNYFDSLNRINNVYFLNNEQININGINFIGFSPSIETYLGRNQRVVDKFLNDYVSAGFTVNEDDYNVLLVHNSLPLTINDTYKSISDFKKTDLVAAGHWHDGYLPKFMDNRIKDYKKGVFMYPWLSPFNGVICRGIHDFERGKLIVSQGFRTWNADMLLFNLFEKKCANDVEKLNLTRKLKKD